MSSQYPTTNLLLLSFTSSKIIRVLPKLQQEKNPGESWEEHGPGLMSRATGWGAWMFLELVWHQLCVNALKKNKYRSTISVTGLTIVWSKYVLIFVFGKTQAKPHLILCWPKSSSVEGAGTLKRGPKSLGSPDLDYFLLGEQTSYKTSANEQHASTKIIPAILYYTATQQLHNCLMYIVNVSSYIWHTFFSFNVDLLSILFSCAMPE